MSGWAIYWITRLDGIQVLLGVAGGVLGLLVLASFIVWTVEDSDFAKRSILPLVVAAIISIVGSVMTPTTKEMAAIYFVPKVVNNENVQQFAGESFDALRELSRQWLEELAPKKGEQ